MKKKIREKSNLFMSMLLIINTLVNLFIGVVPAYAEVTPVDPNNNLGHAEGAPLILKNADIKEFVVTSSAENDGRFTKQFKGKTTPQADDLGTYPYNGASQNMWNTNYPLYTKGTAAYATKITNIWQGDWIKAYHGNVGKYNGKAVDMEVTYSNFNYVDGNINADPDPTIYLDINENPYNGYYYFNLLDFDISVKFYDRETKNVIETKNSFLTFNSLNYHYDDTYDEISEFVDYLNVDTSAGNSVANAYTTSDTNIQYRKIGSGNNTIDKAYIGSSNDFEDFLGSHNFHKNSVSFDLVGQEHRFKVGITGPFVVWNAFSSAFLDTPPIVPEKEITDSESGNSLTGKKVHVGQKIDANIQVETRELGSQIVQKFNRYVVTDKMPKELKFLSGNVYDMKTKEDVTDRAGTFEVDEQTGYVKFVFKEEFLKSGFRYEIGEKYNVVFHMEVREGVADGTVIENIPSVLINDYERDGEPTENEVETNKVRKYVLDRNAKTELELRELKEGEKEVTFRTYSTIMDNSKTTAIRWKDILEKPFSLKGDVKFFINANKENRDVTNDFVRNEKVAENVLQYDVKADKVKDYIGKEFITEFTVTVADDFDFSVYPENKIPNDVSLETNIETVKSEPVHVVPGEQELSINKFVVNNHDELTDFYQLQSNDEKIHYTGEFTVPNRASNDYFVKEVVWFDDLDKALEYKGKDGDLVITDSDGKDVTKTGEFSTEKDGQKLIIKWSGENAKAMAGKKYTYDLLVNYRQGTDLSSYENNMIPNRTNISVTTEDGGEDKTEKESNEVNITPVPNEGVPTKGILNDKGQVVQEYELKNLADNITFTGSFSIPNNVEFEQLGYVDVLEPVFELVEFRVYADKSKKVEIYNSSKDKEVTTKGTFSYDKEKNVVKYLHAENEMQNYAGKTTYTEMDVKFKENADLSAYKDGKVPNPTWSLLVNDKEIPSNEVIVNVPSNLMGLVKKWEVDGKFIDHFDDAKQGEALPTYFKLDLPNNDEVKKLVLQDPLQKGLMTTVDELNNTKITRDGKDVTDQWTLDYNKKTNTITFTLLDNYLQDYQGGEGVEFRFNLFLDPDVDVSKDQNIKNFGVAYLNDDKDGVVSNEVTVDTSADEINKIEKFYENAGNNHALEEKLSITDLSATYPFVLKATINSKPIDKIVIKDELPDILKFTNEPKAYILDSKNEKTDITAKGKFDVNGQNLTFTLTAEEYVKLNNQTIYISYDTILTDKAKAGDEVINIGRLTVDDKEVPKAELPINVPGLENIIEKFVESHANSNNLENQLTITDLNATYPFILRMTVNSTPKEQIVIKDILPDILEFTGNPTAYIFDNSNKKIDVSSKGKFASEGQLLTFTMSADEFNKLNVNQIYIRYETTPTEKAKAGSKAENVAHLLVDGKEVPKATLPINVSDKEDSSKTNDPKEKLPQTGTGSNGTGSNGTGYGSNLSGSSSSGKSLPQTGEQIFQGLAFVGGVLVLSVLSYYVYQKKSIERE